MKIISIKENKKYLKEYIMLCSLEWGSKNTDEDYINNKLNRINNSNKIIDVLGLFDDSNMIGFISLFVYDGEEKRDLSPWYATLYIKEEYRGKGYSKLLNDAIIKDAKGLGYKTIYLKTDLVNYYEKFGARQIGLLNNGEILYEYQIK